jgi:copper chaperone CopZ
MERSETEGSTGEEIALSVPGMTCRHCVRAISRQVLDVAVKVDLTSWTIHVRGTPTLDAVVSAIATAGYEAIPRRRGTATGEQQR